MTLQRNIGVIVLSVFLILYGLLTAPFLKIHFANSGDLLAVLAMAAGALLLLQPKLKR
jgi:hypothetical protein